MWELLKLKFNKEGGRKLRVEKVLSEAVKKVATISGRVCKLCYIYSVNHNTENMREV